MIVLVRRRIVWFCCLAALACLGCPRNEPMMPIEEGEDSPAQLLPSINVADPRSEPQLLEGFYPLEQGTWRWTEKEFSVILSVPAAVPGHQPNLDARVSLPSALQDLVPMTLFAEVEDVEVGSHVFNELVTEELVTFPIPDGLLADEAALIKFRLDKALGPRDSDSRQLGVIVTSIAIK